MNRPADSKKRVKTLQIFESLNQKAAALRRRFSGEKILHSTNRHMCGLGKEQKKQFTRQMVSLVVMVGVTVGSVVTAKAVAPKALITVDGKEQPAVTISADDTSKILEDAGITVGAHDLVERTADSSTGDKIVVRTAEAVSVTADGETTPVVVHWGDSVATAVKEADSKTGAKLGENDTVSPALTAIVRKDMSISVNRGYTVNLTVDGKTSAVEVQKDSSEKMLSVGEALSQAGVKLGEEDIVTPAKDTAVTDGLAIAVQRVQYHDVTTTEPVAYQTKTIKDSKSPSGTKTVTTKGQNGVRTLVTREKTVDGKTVSTEVISNSVTTQPVDEVVSVGTRSTAVSAYASISSNGTVIDQNGKQISYRKVYTGRCTSYCYGKWTASGLPARRGTVAVNPNIIPYGTRLYICSPDGKLVYGYAVAADTGTAAMDGRIVADLYYSTLKECIQFGARTMNVYVLS